MVTLQKRVCSYIDEHTLITSGSTIIVGLSGGPDSVALLSLLHGLAPSYNITIIAAHLDHQWRVDSSKDQVFCKELTQTLGIHCVIQTAETVNLDNSSKGYQLNGYQPNGSQEELGRMMRRTFFEEVARTHNAQAIALGHHANDQQETFFLRMIRGASIAGLASMKPKNGLYIRPLLSNTKDELIEYLQEKGLSYLVDPTNNDTHYLRNAIRHTVIPALRSCDSRFDGTFFKTLSTVQQTDAYLARVAQESFEKLSQNKEGATLLNVEEFLKIDEFLHHRIVVLWLSTERVPYSPSTAFFNELIRFFQNPGKEHQVNPWWQLVKVGPYVAIERRAKDTP